MASDMERVFRKKRENAAKCMGIDFEKMVLKTGANIFHVVGNVVFIREHWFVSADGKSVHSVCTSRDNDKEVVVCRVCKEYDKAKVVLANEDGAYTTEEIERAECIVGDKTFEGFKFANSWKYKEFAYMNVIDRNTNYSEENKHTVILCKSESQSGVSSGFNGIFDEFFDLVEEHGNYDEYDIRIKKTGKNKDTTYRGYKADDVVLTDEEKSYKTYDLEQIGMPTDDEVLKTWLEIGTKGDKDDKKSENTTGKTKSKKTTNKVAKKVTKKVAEEVKEEEPEEIVEEEVTEEVAVEEPTKVKAKKTFKKKEKKEEPKEEPEESVEMAECPQCDEEISIDSKSCPACGEEFDGVEEED